MKKFSILIVFLFISICSYQIKAQEIQFIPHDTTSYGPLGSEIVIDIDIINVSSAVQTVFILRTANNLPSDWTSSLCLSLCFPPTVDSIVTNSDFGSEPIQPGDTAHLSLHFFTQNNDGTGYVQLQAATTRSPETRITLDLSGTTILTGVNYNNINEYSYLLNQNYPNPFNPSTKISYTLQKRNFVNITVYDILGNEIASLVNSIQNKGVHEITFNASNLPSGTYIYRLNVNGNFQSKKMILIK